MITAVDLIMKILNSIFDSNLKLVNLKRDRRDRIANYFEEISKSLMDAAMAFETDAHPWSKYFEIEHLLEDFFEVVGDTIDNRDLLTTYFLLFDSLTSDRLLLGNPHERAIVDAITVHPPYRPELLSKDLEPEWLEQLEKFKRGDPIWWDFKENPVQHLTEPELKQIIQNEIKKLKEASGKFKAISIKLRATE